MDQFEFKFGFSSSRYIPVGGSNQKYKPLFFLCANVILPFISLNLFSEYGWSLCIGQLNLNKDSLHWNLISKQTLDTHFNYHRMHLFAVIKLSALEDDNILIKTHVENNFSCEKIKNIIECFKYMKLQLWKSVAIFYANMPKLYKTILSIWNNEHSA